MLIFGSQLWKRPDDWTPPVTTHPDPQVMTIARVLAETDPDGMGKWDELVRSARMDGTQTNDYYAEPYGRQIERYIEQAVAVRKALAEEKYIP